MEAKINLRRGCQIAFILFLVTGCTSVSPTVPTQPGPTVTPNPNATASLTPFGPPADTSTATAILPTATPVATLTPTLAPAPAVTPVFVPATYTLSVMMDYAGHSLSVDETIDYPNATGEILTDLVLAIETNIWKNCFLPGNRTVNGQAVTNATIDGNRLDVPLPVPLMPETSLELFIHFDLHLPPADVHHVFGYNDLQTNLVDWYPFVVPYVPGQGWLLHPPANVGENLVYDDQVFDMTLHLTDPGLTAIVAASAPAERISYGWHYRLQNVRSFAFSVSPSYQTSSNKVNGVNVTSYYFGDESSQGQVILDQVSKAVATYSSLFGPDPYPTLAIVESPFYDGMEYDGLFFLSRDYYTGYDGTVLNNLVDIGVHETAHQWWFGSVGNDQAMGPWLDEALATYSEHLFYEQNYPDVTGWENFRVDSFSPSGWVDTDIYHGVDFRTYANAVYLRGAQFLQALRGRMGDPAFFAFLQDYAGQMAGKRATAADFFRILRQHTGADISDLLRQYFQNSH